MIPIDAKRRPIQSKKKIGTIRSAESAILNLKDAHDRDNNN